MLWVLVVALSLGTLRGIVQDLTAIDRASFGFLLGMISVFVLIPGTMGFMLWIAVDGSKRPLDMPRVLKIVLVGSVVWAIAIITTAAMFAVIWQI